MVVSKYGTSVGDEEVVWGEGKVDVVLWEKDVGMMRLRWE